MNQFGKDYEAVRRLIDENKYLKEVLIDIKNLSMVEQFYQMVNILHIAHYKKV